ncbi:MAG: glycosyltransferase family 4 protein [Verrucomicrobiota bacterium JB024]|nr:glycosyltransferase family 4 protein [Verrucomicrobiota bacterium JB024]
MKLRILHIIGGLVGGGAETQLKLLLGGLESAGHQAAVAYLNDDPGFTERGGIACFPLQRRRRLEYWKLHRQLTDIIERFMPDVVHLWFPEVLTIPAALIARSRHIPIVSSQRRSFSAHVSRFNWLRDRAGAIPHYLCDALVTNFPVDHEPAWFQRLYRKHQGAVVRNALAPLEAPPRDLPKPSLGQNCFNILFVGRFAPQKRIPLLIEAFARLDHQTHAYRLHLYGKASKDALEQCRQVMAANGLAEDRVVFAGYSSAWRSIAAQFDAFVLPSVAEGMPNVLLEAMQAGLPCLATDIPEIRSLVTHGEEAWLVEPDNVEALAAGLKELHSNTALRHFLADAGQRFTQRFGVENMVQQYVNIYHHLRHG